MELPDVIDFVRPSVVQIACVVSAGATADFAQIRELFGGKPFENYVLGTGFLVSEGAHVVTAQHVIAAARDMRKRFPPGADVNVHVGIAHPNSENVRANFVATGFNVIDEDSRHDLALLHMQRNPFRGELPPAFPIEPPAVEEPPRTATMNPNRPRDGDGVAVSGYPLGETVLLTNTGIIASSWASTSDEVSDPSVPIPGYTRHESRDVYLADLQTNPGNSGGPVYLTSDGTVIGVLVAGRLTNVIAGGAPAVLNDVPLTADAGVSVVVPARYVCDMLDRHGVT